MIYLYANTFAVQTANTALANNCSKIDARVARWLLMVHDRSKGEEILITHDTLSRLLGIGRPGITEVLSSFCVGGLIREPNEPKRLLAP